MKDKTPRKQIRKYKSGGYVIETQIAPGVIGLEMDGKGFYKEFAKPLMEDETPSEKLIDECKECKYCDSLKGHSKDCFKRGLEVEVKTPRKIKNKKLITL